MGHTSNTDVLILGGGCAGLSLASRLSHGASLDVLVIEPREFYSDDRTWCFWGTESSRAENPLIERAWPMASVSDGDHVVKVDCQERPYCLIRALDFYNHHLDTVSRSKGVTVKLGTRAGNCRKLGSEWETQTSLGTIRSKFVVDTRPNRNLDTEEPLLWQCFLGFEVVVQEETFDPECAQLMNFLPSKNGEIRFVYLLPFSKTRALIEITVVSRCRPSLDELFEMLCPLLPLGAQIVREEKGAIPMGIKKIQQGAKIGFINAGATAGSTRASTGYAYQRIQKWANLCSASLMAGTGVLGPEDDPGWLSFMDQIFLIVLHKEPMLASDIFLRLFQRVPHAGIARFLSDEAKSRDIFSVIAALPKIPFLKALIQTMGHSPRRAACCS